MLTKINFNNLKTIKRIIYWAILLQTFSLGRVFEMASTDKRSWDIFISSSMLFAVFILGTKIFLKKMEEESKNGT